ncbi:MAG: OB-fold nucleic acid binding domain-containing protein [Candidatus Phosphoribacter sp.]|nr:OB-fold nucleic acid binding domain-containing protein [Actinomycetales bacterium]
MATEPGAPGGLARRLLERLTKTSVQLDADELHDTSVSLGATPIAELVERQRATVVGEVRSVALRPQVQVAALVVELFDGTDAITLVWLGRRAIVGIEPGVILRVQGRVTQLRGVRTIYNPAYEIVPQDV